MTKEKIKKQSTKRITMEQEQTEEKPLLMLGEINGVPSIIHV